MQLPDTWRPLLEAASHLPPWWAGVVLGGVLLVLWRARGSWRAGGHERAIKRRQRIAEQAEHDAAGVLRARGYHIIDDQVEHSWTVWLDGQAHTIDLRADYLVSRGPRRYIAEVKSGRSAPSISTAATRRQLLEYRVAYPVDGILLVDMEAVEIHVVDFGEQVQARQPARWRALGHVLVGALLGAAALALALKTL